MTPDLPWKVEYAAGPWYLATKRGLVMPISPVEGPPCRVCGESTSTHRTGTFFWRTDDERLMAGPACFAEIDRLTGPGDAA